MGISVGSGRGELSSCRRSDINLLSVKLQGVKAPKRSVSGRLLNKPLASMMAVRSFIHSFVRFFVCLLACLLTCLPACLCACLYICVFVLFSRLFVLLYYIINSHTKQFYCSIHQTSYSPRQQSVVPYLRKRDPRLMPLSHPPPPQKNQGFACSMRVIHRSGVFLRCLVCCN